MFRLLCILIPCLSTYVSSILNTGVCGETWYTPATDVCCQGRVVPRYQQKREFDCCESKFGCFAMHLYNIPHI